MKTAALRTRLYALMGALAAVALALAALAHPAMADDADASAGGTGTITITNAKAGQEYAVYRIADLESYDASAGRYAYRPNADWEAFLKASSYVTVTADGYLTWAGSSAEASDTEAFAQAALAYAKEADHAIAPTDSKSADADGSVSFTGLPLGYYLVDSTTGGLCVLDTTNPDMRIEDKNEEPTLVKKIVGADGHTLYDESAQIIGGVVKYRLTVTAPKGATSYQIEDVFDEGLTYNDDDFAIVKNAGEYADSSSSVADDVTATRAYADQKLTITLDFGNLGTQATYTISYSATLNEKAVTNISGVDGEQGNSNTAVLKYGKDYSLSTQPQKVTTYCSYFDLVKTDASQMVDGKRVVIDGAEFDLYRAVDGVSTLVPLVKTTDSEGRDCYRPATAAEQAAEGFVSAKIKAGVAHIEGLGRATYRLQETTAPTGYNLKKDYTEIRIDGKNEPAVTQIAGDKTVYVSGGVEVQNQSGTELPSTGGIGTTVFYVAGGALVLVAVVALVVRKKMSAHTK